MQTICEEFTSEENFRLAWERVRYYDRPDSRDWIGLKIFGANRDHNLEVIRQGVIHRTFEPSWPEIKYMPKQSLTLRPMAMLSVTDRIVFQAIGNVIASRARPLLATVANKQSFANVLTASSQKPFFVHWKHQYHLFQQKYLELVNEGNVWIAETDAAAFYETIDHVHLIKILMCEELLDDLTLEHFQQYLPIWSAIRPQVPSQRGVPQGCLTSDLLANTYLYPFDRELAAQEYYYLRYVDDIRLLGRSKEAVQRGLIRVDTALKVRGLLLQTKKTIVRHVDDVAEETDRLAGLLSEIDTRLRDPEDYAHRSSDDPLARIAISEAVHLHDDADLLDDTDDVIDESQNIFHNLPPDLRDEYLSALQEVYDDVLRSAQEELQKLFWKALKALLDDSDQFAERHVRFALFRLAPTAEITQAVLPLFLERPRIAEVMNVYLRKAELEAEAIEYLQHTVIAEHSVYDSAISLAIRILHQHGLSLRRHQARFRKWLLDDERDWPLREASALALGESPENLSVLLDGLSSQSAMVRRMALIQALRLSESKEMARYIASKIIDDKSPDVIHTLLYLLYSEWDLKLSDLESETKSATDYCRQIASGYDKSLPTAPADYIRHIFIEQYHVVCGENVDFRVLLGTDYEAASAFLRQAQTSFLVNPSRYISQLDLFHEELMYPIMVDKLQIRATRTELALATLGSRIDMLNKSKEGQGLRTFVGAIATCHQLRANPETHSRFHNNLNHTARIKPRQRDNLKTQLRGGYQQLVNWMEEGCPK